MINPRKQNDTLIKPMNAFNSFIKFLSKTEAFYLIFIAIISSFIFIDKPISRFFQQYRGTTLFHINEFITYFGKGGLYIVLSLAGFLIFRFIFKKKTLANQFLFIFLALCAAGVLCDLIKVLLSRARPTEFWQNGIYGFQFIQFKASMWSFPSGHATIISALMIALSLLYSRYWVSFMVILIVVGTSRIILNAHYLSDTIAGFYLGAIVTIYIFNQFQKRDKLKLVDKASHSNKPEPLSPRAQTSLS